MTDKPKPKRGPGKPFEKGNPGRPQYWTVERMMPALKDSRGNYTLAARLLSQNDDGVTCHRETVRRMVRKHPELKRVCEEAWIAALETMHDQMTESALDGDQRAQALILTRFHPGYRQKQEHFGPGGGPVQVAVAPTTVNPEVDKMLQGVNLNNLSHAEQIELGSLVYTQIKNLPLSTAQAERAAQLVAIGRAKQIEAKSEPE